MAGQDKGAGRERAEGHDDARPNRVDLREQKATITLAHPIEIHGAQVSQITMRRPLVGDLRAAQRSSGSSASTAELEIAMFANLCEIAPDDWDRMDLGDYRAVQEAYEGFLSRGSTSGAQGRS